ncbi:MAG: anaerobic ribonucleoside-triphosphate reductase activating protein [Moraxellaceae bacterium]|nr:anaerobic ribonucleoside-triphosphate reductase activating protein [Moraxellaceae bacterium]
MSTDAPRTIPVQRAFDDDHPVAPWQERIRISAFVPFSTVDWPGSAAAVVFLQGCPWRCGYCQNPQLQARIDPPSTSWQAIEGTLRQRTNWLDSVVFSGGEPTTDRALPDAVRAVMDMGYRTGLHTGGAYPERLAGLLPLLDWVGFDIKADAAHYDSITGAPGSALRAMRSARLLLASGVACEFRMTYHSALLSELAVLRAADLLATLGVRRFVLQEFRPEGVTNALAPHTGISERLLRELDTRFPLFGVRRADGNPGCGQISGR